MLVSNYAQCRNVFFLKKAEFNRFATRDAKLVPDPKVYSLGQGYNVLWHTYSDIPWWYY